MRGRTGAVRDRQPNPRFTRRSRNESVLVGTSHGCGGSDAAGLYGGVLVIKFVVELVCPSRRRIHRCFGQRECKQQRARGQR
jgi:hypothetical protein